MSTEFDPGQDTAPEPASRTPATSTATPTCCS